MLLQLDDLPGFLVVGDVDLQTGHELEHLAFVPGDSFLLLAVCFHQFWWGCFCLTDLTASTRGLLGKFVKYILTFYSLSKL